MINFIEKRPETEITVNSSIGSSFPAKWIVLIHDWREQSSPTASLHTYGTIFFPIFGFYQGISPLPWSDTKKRFLNQEELTFKRRLP